jgi:hypothetical protein
MTSKKSDTKNSKMEKVLELALKEGINHNISSSQFPPLKKQPK